MKTKLKSDGTIMPRSSAAVGCAVATFDLAPPVPPLDFSLFFQKTQFAFSRFPAGWFADWRPAPRRQFFFFFSGEIEIVVGDGEVRRFGLGSIVLLEDIKARVKSPGLPARKTSSPRWCGFPNE